MEEIILCLNCQEKFDRNIRIPRSLTCGHSICEICTFNMISSQEQFSCPKDCKKTDFRDKTIEDFPKNFSTLKILHKNYQYDDSSSKNKIYSLGKHKSCEYSGSHQLNNIKRNVFKKFDFQNNCETHSKIKDIFCESCQMYVCYYCALFEGHKNHEFKSH